MTRAKRILALKGRSTYYAAAEVFSAEDVRLLDEATLLVERMPGRLAEGGWVRCHELARAVSAILGPTVRGRAARCRAMRAAGRMPVCDGWYGRVEHSWIVTPGWKILDVYAVGRLSQVQLIDPRAGASMYRETADRNDIRQDIVARLVRRVERAAIIPGGG